MKTIQYSFVVLAAALQLPACQEPTSPAAGPSAQKVGTNDTAKMDSSARQVGLPVDTDGGVDCVPGPDNDVQFADWARDPDAIVVGTVEDVAINRAIVFNGPDPISFSDCQIGTIEPGLVVTLSDIEVVSGDFTPQKTSFVIGGDEAYGWDPAPVYDPKTDGLGWVGQGAAIGPGLRIGAALYWRPDWQTWSQRGRVLFEVDPSGDVAFQSVRWECGKLVGAGFATQPLKTFEAAVQAAVANSPAPTDRPVIDGDPNEDARHWMATTCGPGHTSDTVGSLSTQ